jgi:hypothetical protein
MNRDWFNLKNKLSQNNITFSNHGSDDIHNGRNLESNIVAFMETSKSVTLPNDSWICDSGACGHQC